MKGLITNDWDRDNLNFLLQASPEVMQDWDLQADEEDRIYAQELLAAYAEELRLEAQDLKIEALMSLMFEFKDAQKVIDKIAK
jgi:hypothetical protein